MMEKHDVTAAAPPIALREEDGTIREDYVERVAAAIAAAPH